MQNPQTSLESGFPVENSKEWYKNKKYSTNLQVYQMNDWKLPLGIYLLSINLPGQQNKRRENYKIEMLF
jgi:hypothetical protein